MACGTVSRASAQRIWLRRCCVMKFSKINSKSGRIFRSGDHTWVGVGKYHVGLVKLEKVLTLESVDSESGSQVRVIGKHFNINSWHFSTSTYELPCYRGALFLLQSFKYGWDRNNHVKERLYLHFYDEWPPWSKTSDVWRARSWTKQNNMFTVDIEGWRFWGTNQIKQSTFICLRLAFLQGGQHDFIVWMRKLMPLSPPVE